MAFLLQVQDLSKAFPGVQALDRVRLDIEPGKVHAVIGENGAGKSTLMNVLIGLHQPDDGELRFKGRTITVQNPHEALKLGISMIHQELMPLQDMTVAENIFLGREPASRWMGWLDRTAMRRDAGELLRKLDVPLSPQRRMRGLSLAEMQTVEIAKALAYQADLIIMDEPTSAISDREVERLFSAIRDLKKQGVAVVYISHKLDEIFEICDTVTVLRDGQYIGTYDIGELNIDRMISLMVGRELKETFPTGDSRRDDVVLSVSGLTRTGKFKDVSFEARRGEILGIAGLMGAGRTEVLSAIYGLEPFDAGEISVHGNPVRINHPSEAIRNGLAMVTEDRKEYGLVLNMAVKHNVTLTILRKICRAGFIDRAEEDRTADRSIRDLSIKISNRNQTAASLSGGNQQKIVLAKALLTEPEVLLLDEPTRGIDISAKAEVYKLISQLAEAGKAVVLVSSELQELLSLSDRILVMREGEITAEFEGRKATQEEIMKVAVPVAV
ncbi:MAG: sugar ABC transporter ATP-binding protein [Kiritimatiellia bacterium]|nr:sugar ABC transporter ATP-binding protein [Kiritimatiellia bacterium]